MASSLRPTRGSCKCRRHGSVPSACSGFVHLWHVTIHSELIGIHSGIFKSGYARFLRCWRHASVVRVSSGLLLRNFQLLLLYYDMNRINEVSFLSDEPFPCSDVSYCCRSIRCSQHPSPLLPCLHLRLPP